MHFTCIYLKLQMKNHRLIKGIYLQDLSDYDFLEDILITWLNYHSTLSFLESQLPSCRTNSHPTKQMLIKLCAVLFFSKATLLCNLGQSNWWMESTMSITTRLEIGFKLWRPLINITRKRKEGQLLTSMFNWTKMSLSPSMSRPISNPSGLKLIAWNWKNDMELQTLSTLFCLLLKKEVRIMLWEGWSRRLVKNLNSWVALLNWLLECITNSTIWLLEGLYSLKSRTFLGKTQEKSLMSASMEH